MAEREEFNILISSAGRRVALLEILRRTLEQLGLRGKVLAADASRMSSAFHSSDRGFVVPKCTSEAFIPAMLEICQQNNVRLLVPTLDPELPVYAAHRQSFLDIGTTIAVSRPEVVAIGADKVQTHAWLTQMDFPTVRQTTVAGVLAKQDEWQFPLLVKPRGGSSSIGVSFVRDVKHLEIATQGGEYVVQTIARGHEYTVDFLANRRGKCVCAIPRRRLEVRSGEVSKSLTVVSAQIQGLTARLCETLPGAYGVLNVQMFHDPQSGELSVIEINPRFGGGFPLSWEAGGHFPAWMIEEILGRVTTASATSWKGDVVMLRYDAAVFLAAEHAGL